ncbi:hypothetical protein F4826_002930 [Rahnella inusitata]|nr:hypothetical protein [Rahnella inusitata]
MISCSRSKENGCVAGIRCIFDEKWRADLYNPDHTMMSNQHWKLNDDAGFTGTDL